MKLQAGATALELVEASIVPRGLVASSQDTANYRRVWTRDAVVCGIAGSLAGSDKVLDALARSLKWLASARGPNGEIPSSIASDGDLAPSYGGLAGRIDCGAWFAIGAAHVLHWRPESALREPLREVVTEVFRRYDCLELNARGLIHSPLGGDWADDYCLHGYVLLPNLLRIWALELCGRELDEKRWLERAKALRGLVARTFWVGAESDDAEHYHPEAYRRARAQPPLSYWRAALSPAGYALPFDGLGNALALLLELGTASQTAATVRSTDAVRARCARSMVPAFWPPIEPGDPQWPVLEGMAGHGFRNRPGQYHNGGLWPMVNGFWVAAYARSLQRERAVELAGQLREATSGFFPEYFDGLSGEPGGVTPCTWSAAGVLIAGASLDGHYPKGLSHAG